MFNFVHICEVLILTTAKKKVTYHYARALSKKKGQKTDANTNGT